MWLAGAGVKKGFSYGATDEYGLTRSRAGCTPPTCTRRCWR